MDTHGDVRIHISLPSACEDIIIIEARIVLPQQLYGDRMRVGGLSPNQHQLYSRKLQLLTITHPVNSKQILFGTDSLLGVHTDFVKIHA